MAGQALAILGTFIPLSFIDSWPPRHPSNPLRGPSHKEKEVSTVLFVLQEGQSHGRNLSSPGTITILSGRGQMAPNGCTFRIATGRVEKKKNKKNNKKKKADEKGVQVFLDTFRLVPGTITIQGGGRQMAPTGCTFRIVTGRIEKKKNKKNNKKKTADQKLTDKVSESVSAIQIE
ncbi:uncharacterized protein FPRN_02864 [Fusarium proliferatum]|nr:uncharacterized protein FPRN_02864 [Fusarium proliferatum]